MKKVVIVGGGFSGSYIARKLERKFEVTLVDTKNYFEFTPSILNTLINPDYRKKIEVLHKNYLSMTKIIQGEVTSVNNSYVFVGAKKIPFDYLVICSGSSYRSPIKSREISLANRASELERANKKILKAKRIAVIGDGPVGVELAAEIGSHFLNKEILLVSPHEILLSRFPKSAGVYAKNYFEKMGVKIIFGERVVAYKNGVLHMQSGKSFDMDVAFACTGIAPNSGFMQKNFRKFIDEGGFLVVDKNLQLRGINNIFVAGDVNNCGVEKTAQNAEKQAKIVVKNILALESGRKMKKYSEKKTPLVLSLGRTDGIFLWEKFMLSGIIPAFLKWAIERKEIIKLKWKV